MKGWSARHALSEEQAAVLLAQELDDALVELVIADGGELEPHQRQRFDRRLVGEEGGEQRRGADQIAGGDEDRVLRLRPFLLDQRRHRLDARRPAPRWSFVGSAGSSILSLPGDLRLPCRSLMARIVRAIGPVSSARTGRAATTRPEKAGEERRTARRHGGFRLRGGRPPGGRIVSRPFPVKSTAGRDEQWRMPAAPLATAPEGRGRNDGDEWSASARGVDDAVPLLRQ